MHRQPSAGTDLSWVVERALERGGSLLTPEEHAVLGRLLDLPDDVRSSWARRARRTHAVQLADGPHDERLLADDLLVDDVTWPERATHSTAIVLRAGARRLGLDHRGRRVQLQARLVDQVGWSDQRWLRVPHRRLVQRCDRFAFLHRWPDPSRPVVERLGHVVWPDYPLGDCPPLFASRDALLAWEAVADQVALAHDDQPVDARFLADALDAGHTRAPGRLDLTGSAAKVLFALARDLERSHATAEARALHERVLPHIRSTPQVHVRIARTLEAEGRPHDAWKVLHDQRGLRGPEARALHRAGRRLGKSTRRGWAPLPPRPPRVERTLPLARVGSRTRPLFGSGVPVEEAVIEQLHGLQRTALHAEGGLWRHLYGLCLAADAYFEPVGQLPARYLSGPLDVGTRRFAERRPQVVTRVLDTVRQGRAAELVRRTHASWEGRQLAGVSWRPLAEDVALVEAIGPALLHEVLSVLLERGWRAAGGMPDLMVLPGPEVRIPGAMPSRLGEGLLLAEVKTPNDTLSDTQRWWIERLVPVVPVEVWRVRPVALPGSAP